MSHYTQGELNIFARIRKQCNSHVEKFLDFVHHPKNNEIILKKQINDMIQFGREKEFGIPVTIIFDQTTWDSFGGHALMRIKYNKAVIFSFKYDSAEEFKRWLCSCQQLIQDARRNAYDSIFKYLPYCDLPEKIDPKQHQLALDELSDEGIDNLLKEYRGRYITYMATTMINAGENDKFIQTLLSSQGLTTVKDFFDRHLTYIEELFKQNIKKD